MDPPFVDDVAEKCIAMYNKLPKTGKPIDNEWTVLSCVVKLVNIKEIEIVSLGTGSKCIGATKMCPKGNILNDSHAEVMARRGFLLYLYENISKTLEGKQSIFILEDGKCSLKNTIEFIFYSSQLPCGDASIIPKSGDEEQFGDIITPRKRQANVDTDNGVAKTLKVCDDIYRTGAKCLPNSEQDARTNGSNYHLLGHVRTKPGRGDRTLSTSCSDKMARWIHLGIQGSLIDMLLNKPVYITNFIFGAKVPFSNESLNRALLYRNTAPDLKMECVPKFYQSSMSFPNIRTEERLRPAPGSIVWILLDNPILEVAILGKKLGVTKKKADLASSSLCISKSSIFKKFLTILSKNNDLKQLIVPEQSLISTQYSDIKSRSVKYNHKWLSVKEKVLKSWTVKPDIWNFSIPNL